MISRQSTISIAVSLVMCCLLVWILLIETTGGNTLEVSGGSLLDTTSVRSGETSPSSTADIVFPVEVTIARRADLIKGTTSSGTLRARREVEIAARVPGEAVLVSVHNGKFVRAGELLVKLDSREYRLALDRASSNLLGAQIEYKALSSLPFLPVADSARLHQMTDSVKQSFLLVEKAHRKGAVTQDDLARAQREVQTSLAYLNANRGDVIANKSGLAQAREAYERAKLNLEWTEIRAPFSGYVADCGMTQGMHVQVGRPLFSILDVSALLVEVHALETEVGKIAISQTAEVVPIAFPGQHFLGRVLTMNPVVDPRTKTTAVTIVLTGYNRKGRKRRVQLKPGMHATVKIQTEVLKDRLLVPREALLERDERMLLFVVEGSAAKWRYVEVGEENDESIEIHSGIIAGDTVIVEGHYMLAHDAKVSVLACR